MLCSTAGPTCPPAAPFHPQVVARLKEMVGELPAAPGDDDDSLLAALDPASAAAAAAADPVLAWFDARQQDEQQRQAQQAQQQQLQADAEADPFGLDALLAAQAAAPPPPPPKSVTWSPAEVAAQRRAALLDCLDAARGAYR